MMRLTAFALWIAASACAADWNPRLAARYLDGRQQEWFAWPSAKRPGGPCVSCHTGVPYLMARPALRRLLGEADPTAYETGLLDALRARADKREAKDIYPSFQKEPGASQAVGVEAILAGVLLRSPEALDRMWSVQAPDGGWHWFSLKLDPWEKPESRFYGAALALLAAGSPEQIAKVRAFLEKEQAGQPLHNRLLLLWTPGAKNAKAIAREALQKQQKDGGWTLEALGPWEKPPAGGSDSYATALTAVSLLRGGMKPQDAGMRRALDWLAKHQDRESGAWTAHSMNKDYPPESMMAKFMTDAATAYAALALAGGR